jgi:hypothetical protein
MRVPLPPVSDDHLINAVQLLALFPATDADRFTRSHLRQPVLDNGNG